MELRIYDTIQFVRGAFLNVSSVADKQRLHFTGLRTQGLRALK
jgi:hypothetical protein